MEKGEGTPYFHSKVKNAGGGKGEGRVTRGIKDAKSLRMFWIGYREKARSVTSSRKGKKVRGEKDPNFNIGIRRKFIQSGSAVKGRGKCICAERL